MDNKFRLEFNSSSDNERFARSVAAAFVIKGADLTVTELSEIKTAVSEAVTNAIIHGYCGREGTIVLEGAMNKNEVIFTVTDTGEGIEDIELARRPLFTMRPDLERSGMGFTIMESFMDNVEVESERGRGTRVSMIKRIRGAQDDDE